MAATSTIAGFAGRYDPAAEDSTEATLRRLRWLANFLDTAVRLPGGFRFGADTFIGLAPGVGDLATAAIACYFVYEGKRLGLPKSALVAMAGNVALDLVLGATPILGDLADTWFKANVRNLAIIEKHVGRHRP
jgi:hypothetical protein